VRLLLDTHTFLWALGGVARLSRKTAALIRNPAHEVYLSAASLWEIGIKKACGKLTAPDHLAAAAAERGIVGLPITLAHAEVAGALPGHHRDPFDRMLVAQAQVEKLCIVTDDRRIALYDVQTVRAR